MSSWTSNVRRTVDFRISSCSLGLTPRRWRFHENEGEWSWPRIPTVKTNGRRYQKILATRSVFPSLCHRRLMLSPGDFLVGRGAVASSHHFKPTFYRSADPVHVSPCFGAPSCFVCLAEVALSQDEVGSFRIGAAPGEGDEGPKTQRVDMTKKDIYSMTQLPRHKAATLMRVGSSADMLILVDFPG